MTWFGSEKVPESPGRVEFSILSEYQWAIRIEQFGLCCVLLTYVKNNY